MKKTMILVIILIMIGLAGCVKNDSSYISESLYEESTLESATDTSSLPESFSEETSEEDLPSASNPADNETSIVSSAPNPTTTPIENAASSTASAAPQPPETISTTSSTESTTPMYTQQDYDDIIRIVREYAESQDRLKFIWKPTMKKDDGLSGYHGTPGLKQKGKDGIIATLKYHVDLTIDVVTDPNNGIPSTTVGLILFGLK